jgi:hypothetical protein
MKRTPIVRKTPLRSRSTTPKVKHPERTAQLGRMKRKRVSKTELERQHLGRIASMRCIVSNEYVICVHHLMKAPGKRTRRDHRWVIPIAPRLHNMGDDSIHGLGSEEAFERKHGLVPGFLIAWAKREWEASCNE